MRVILLILFWLDRKTKTKTVRIGTEVEERGSLLSYKEQEGRIIVMAKATDRTILELQPERTVTGCKNSIKTFFEFSLLFSYFASVAASKSNSAEAHDIFFFLLLSS